MLTAQVEPLHPSKAERDPLLDKHYAALSNHKRHGFPLTPQYEVYLAREARGELLYVTLRDSGALVGYFIGFIAPGLHYATCLTLTMDIFWVAEDHRGRFGGVKLFRQVLAEAKRRGVDLMFVGHKTHMPEAKRLFEHFGFAETERSYALWFDKER